MTRARLIARMAWRNVRRHWRHSLAAFGTMAVGFVALALFQGYLDELFATQTRAAYARNMIGDMLVRKPGGGTRDARITPEAFRLDGKEQAFLEAWLARHQAEVLTRVRTLIITGMASAGGSTASMIAVGHDVAEGRVARREWAWNAWAGHPLGDGDANGAVLAMGLAAILGCEPDAHAQVFDPLTATPIAAERPLVCKHTDLTLTTTSARGRMNALDAEVTGITVASSREFNTRLIWLPLPFAQRLATTDRVSQYMVLLRDPARGPALRAELAHDAAAAGVALEVTHWIETEQADGLRRALGLIRIYRSLVVVVILIIAGAAVLTSMMKTVRERTREVGTLRSLGYLRRHLLAMFAAEAAVLALAAGVAGSCASVLITLAVNSAHISYKAGLLSDAIPLRLATAPAAHALGFVFLVGVAMCAAFVAARRVVNLVIAQALTE